MINTIILTCSSQGSASVQLAELIKSKKIKIKSVVLSEGNIANKRKYFKRKIKKASLFQNLECLIFIMKSYLLIKMLQV